MMVVFQRGDNKPAMIRGDEWVVGHKICGNILEATKQGVDYHMQMMVQGPLELPATLRCRHCITDFIIELGNEPEVHLQAMFVDVYAIAGYPRQQRYDGH